MPPKKEKSELARRMQIYGLFLQYLAVWMEKNQDRILKEAYEQFQQDTGLTV